MKNDRIAKKCDALETTQIKRTPPSSETEITTHKSSHNPRYWRCLTCKTINHALNNVCRKCGAHRTFSAQEDE